MAKLFQFGAAGDVALRRIHGGALSAEATYFQADEFRVGQVRLDNYIQNIVQAMLGDVTLEEYIEQTVRQRELVIYCLRPS